MNQSMEDKPCTYAQYSTSSIYHRPKEMMHIAQTSGLTIDVGLFRNNYGLVSFLNLPRFLFQIVSSYYTLICNLIRFVLGFSRGERYFHFKVVFARFVVF